MRVDTRLSERLKKVQPSLTLAITSKAKKLKAEGKDVVSFAAGEPDFDTPDFIKEAAIEAIRSGFTKYTPTTGIPELKDAICEKFKNDNGIVYSPNQIVVSNGAKHSIFNALMALVRHDDEVLIPTPYWVSYPEMVHICEGRPVFIKTKHDNNFKLTGKELEKYITIQTKLLILNSPSNPCGTVYSCKELEEIACICVNKRIFVLSDEIYEKITFDNLKHFSIAALNPAIYPFTITVNGFSKSHSMTGWRIGYLGGPQDIVEAISKLQDHSTSNPCSIAQKAALAALCATGDFEKMMCSEFEKRRNYCLERLSKIKKLTFIAPQGAFYIFCGISKVKLDSFVFAQRLLDEAFVALIPGMAFGKDDYIRMSFAVSMEQLKKGLDRIESWLSSLDTEK